MPLRQEFLAPPARLFTKDLIMKRWFVLAGLLVGLLAVAIGAYATRARWSSWLHPATETAAADAPLPISEVKVLKVSSQARENMKLVSKPLKLETYWRTIQLPGEVVDRPGISDRGVTAPAVGVVAEVHAFPGDTVRPGDSLFKMRIFSEYLQNTQSELFKASRETQLLTEQRKRLEGLAKEGAVAEVKMIEVENQLRRQAALIQAYRQDLLTRGFIPTQIDGVAEGRFVSTIDIVAPPLTLTTAAAGEIKPETIKLIDDRKDGPIYEVQELKVELGQQVQAGQLLSVLANHNVLYIEGHAFKQEAPYLERAAQDGRPITVEFAEDDIQHWPALEQTFQIRHLANTIDAVSRTFDFFIPLTNQSRSYEKSGQTFVVWRFRPGQRVRLHVPVEEFKDVVVLPAGAVVREGPEAFVFRQNGDLFNRIPVHVLHEDRLRIVLEQDDGLTPGLYLAQNSAASLNRVLKAQAASGVRADVHVHADGSTHAAH
jgi:cobalt-zinc-cadmium efflux system membrane fusion protein